MIPLVKDNRSIILTTVEVLPRFDLLTLKQRPTGLKEASFHKGQ